MKSVFMMLVAGSSLFTLSCNNSTETTETSTDSSSVSSSTPVNDADAYAGVPQSNRTSFEARYPNASNVKWSKYSRDANRTPDASDWDYKLDSSDYVVYFNWDGQDYTSWYDDTSWIRTTAKVSDHSKLPKAVNDAIHNKFADYTITSVDKENDKNETRYEVELEKGGNKVKVTIAEDGRIVKQKGDEGKAKEDTK